jgi:hypothetical protein
MKLCLKCRLTLPIEEFHLHSKTFDGRKSNCKKCRAEYETKYRKENKDKLLEVEARRRIRNAESIRVSAKKYYLKTHDERLAYRLENTYGITITQYDEMYESQNGLCKICQVDQDQLERRLCVDHCHVTGRVRGLLCDPCNRLLGQAKDRIHVLLKAAEYLKESNDSTIP